MVDPISLVGVIATAIKLLNLAVDCTMRVTTETRNYKAFAKVLQEMQEVAEDCQSRVKEWSQGWKLESTDDHNYGFKVWGVSGWTRVTRLLCSVDEKCLDLISSFAELDLDKDKIAQHREASAARRAEEKDLPKGPSSNKLRKPLPLQIQARHYVYNELPNDQRRSAIQARSDERNLISNSAGFTKKMGFIIQERDIIVKNCNALKESIDYLEQRSLQLFLIRYTHLRGSASIDERVAAIEARHVVLENAERLWKSAMLLYQHCTSKAAVQDIRLAVENIAEKDLEEQVSTYRVWYEPMGDRAQGLTVQCLSYKPVGNILPGFDDAWAAASMERNVHFSTAVDAYYALKMLQLLPPAPDQTKDSLATLLEALESKGTIGRHTKFPIVQRQALAYHIAGSALRLLGTSWLLALSSKNITQFRREHHSEYLLKVLESDQRRCKLLQELKPYGESGQIDAELWSVGILLFEVMMGMKVTDILKKREQPFALILHDFSVVEVDGPHFGNILGTTLGGAIAQCFTPTTKLSNGEMSTEDYHASLATFNETVYLPLENIYLRSEERRQRVRQAAGPRNRARS